MKNVSEGFSSIFSELDRLREAMQGQANMVRLLEYELQEERKLRRHYQALVTQARDHAMMIAEECERGEPIVPLPGGALHLIEPATRDDVSLKLAAIEQEAQATRSNPGSEVTPDWLVGAMPSNPTNKLANSYVLGE